MGGKPRALQEGLRARGDHLANLISTRLWDEESSAFVNAFSTNGTYNARITPTSFYALGTGAPTGEQATRMVTRWLTNASAFCVAPNGDFTGNDENGCYWGLPS